MPAGIVGRALVRSCTDQPAIGTAVSDVLYTSIHSGSGAFGTYMISLTTICARETVGIRSARSTSRGRIGLLIRVISVVGGDEQC